MAHEMNNRCKDSVEAERAKREYVKPELQSIEIATLEILGASDEPAQPGDDPWG